MGYPESIKEQWAKYWSRPSFRKQFIVSLACLIALIIFFNHFFLYIQLRNGKMLDDWLLSRIPADDISAWLFPVLYFSIIAGFIHLLQYPRSLLRLITAAAIIYTLRTLTLWLIPLDPPAGCIPLQDPVTQYLTYGRAVITKDLFFSGHTTTLLLLLLAARSRVMKIFFLLGLIAVIILLLVQHAHYTIDILGALVFTYGGWYVSGKMQAGFNQTGDA